MTKRDKLNVMQEKYAQQVALGKPQRHAYVEAGYEPSDPNASRMRNNDKVGERIDELVETSMKEADITRDMLFAMNMDIAKSDEPASIRLVALKQLMAAKRMFGSKSVEAIELLSETALLSILSRNLGEDVARQLVDKLAESEPGHVEH